MKQKIILASTSPRRKELLETTGILFSTIQPDFEEKHQSGEKVDDYTKRNSIGKAESVLNIIREEEFIIIGSDTVVCLDNKILEKPNSKAEAFDMLSMLSGKSHSVYSGFCILKKQKDKDLIKILDHVETKVYFRDLDSKEISDYIETGDPMDKSGAYGIQGGAGSFVKKIDGSYSNVMGLPLAEIIVHLKK